MGESPGSDGDRDGFARTTASSEPILPRIWKLLAFVLPIYVGLRALILITNFDSVCMPSYELATIGNHSKVLADGDGGAPQQMHFDNVGGHLVAGWLAAPLYAWFGDSYLTLKLVPFAIGVFTLVVIVLLLATHFGPRAAAIGAVLFALAPPTLTKYSVIAKGNHFEQLLFLFAFIAAYFELLRGVHRRWWLVATGLLAGAATSFYTGALLTVVFACVSQVAVRGVRGALRDAPWAAGAFAVGVAPLFLLDLLSGGRVRNFLWFRFWQDRSRSLEEVWVRLWDFWTNVLPRSTCFESFAGVSGRVADRVFVACFAAAWVFLAWDAARGWWRHSRAARSSPSDARPVERDRARCARLFPFLLHLPVMSVVIALFGFRFKAYAPPVEVGEYRYLVTHFAFAVVLIAIAAGELARRPAWLARAAGATVAAAALATGLFTLPIVDLSMERAGCGTRYPGYWFEYYANVVLRDSPWRFDRVESYLSTLRPEHGRRAYAGVGFYAAWSQDSEATSVANANGEPHARAPFEVDAILAKFPPAYAIDLCHGAGSYLRRLPLEGPPGNVRLEAILESFDASEDATAPYVVEGLGLDLKYPLASSTKAFFGRGASLRTLCPERWRPALERGLGIASGRLVARAIESDLESIRDLAGGAEFEQLPSFYFGVGWGAAETSGTLDALPQVRALVPEEYHPCALQGAGAALRHVFGSATAADACARDAGRASTERSRWVDLGLAWSDYPREYRIQR